MSTMDAYDEAQNLILSGMNADDVEMQIIKRFPEVNAQGLVPTVLRRAYRDLAKG